MDEMTIRTEFARKIAAKFIERKLRKALKRKISLLIQSIELRHKENGVVELALNAVATMDEAELIALLEQMSGEKGGNQ